MINQIVSIIFPVFAAVTVGFLISRFFKLDFTAINKVNMEALIPALVFSSLATMPLSGSEMPLIHASLVAILVPGVIMLLIAKMFALNFRAWAPPHMFRNSGNLAIPLFTYTFGESAIAPAVLLFVMSACIHITIGLAVLSNGNPFKQVFQSPVFVAAALGIGINLAGFELWQPLYHATDLLGQAAVPLMLLSLGSQMRFLKWTGIKIGLWCTVQSLLTGAVAFGIIYFFIPLPKMQMQMMVLFSMLPPAVMNYLFAERYQIEPNKVASMVLFGNFFGVLTLPLLLTIALAL